MIRIIPNGKIQLNIRSGGKIPRIGETVDERRTNCENARTAEDPFGAFPKQSQAAPADRLDALHPDDEMDHVVVLQVRADAGQFMQDRNTKVCEQCWWTDP